MSSKTVAIFGANSISAKKLIEQLKVKNYLVTPYSSKSSSENYYNLYEPNVINFDFDCAVFFSWATDRSRKCQMFSAHAATEFARLARENNVDVVFISSLAALPSSKKSHYGYAKNSAEKAMRDYGHTIVRPATVLSDDNENASSAYENLFEKRFMVSIFSHFSEEMNIPTTYLSRLTETLIQCVDEPRPIEINLIESIGNLETLAGVRTPLFRFPIRWNFIGILKTRSTSLDRLLTVISVSNWIRENQGQFESKK